MLFLINVNGIDEETAQQVANEFRENLENIDPMSLSSIFYKDYIYSIEEGDIPVHFNPIHYVKAGRHFKDD